MNSSAQIELETLRSRLLYMRRSKGFGCWWEILESPASPEKAHRCLSCSYPDKDDYCLKAKKACMVLESSGMDPVAPVQFREGMPPLASPSPGQPPAKRAPTEADLEVVGWPLSELARLNVVVGFSSDRGPWYLASNRDALMRLVSVDGPVFLASELQELLALPEPARKDALDKLWNVKAIMPGAVAHVEKVGG